MNYRCSVCDFETDKIPIFKKGECPYEIQHYFIQIQKEKNGFDIS